MTGRIMILVSFISLTGCFIKMNDQHHAIKKLKRHLISFCIAALFSQRLFAADGIATNEPDSVYLFSYGANGLRFAWSSDKQEWTNIGNGYSFIVSDYGRWGSEKKMKDPYLIQGRGGEWQLVIVLRVISKH